MENIQSTVARSHANSTSHIKPRRAGVPCVRCRQMKVKCNASQKFPASCSACEKAGERCAVDPSFKRTPKRSQKRRHGYEEGDTAYKTPHSEQSGTEPTESPSRPDEPLPGSDFSVARITAELRLGGKRSARFIHEPTGVNFSSSVVAESLEEYYSRLHPKFPSLLDPAAIIDSYDKAPLLFWSVLAVASKGSGKHAPDYPRLQILSRQLVADILLLGTRSIYLVQALLLLCVWSFPLEDMNKESSSMYCAVAISMARSLGLHRPQYPFPLFAAKESEVGTLGTRMSTWSSCFIVDQWHTARFGVPSSIRIDYTVLHAMNVSMPGIPATTKIQLHIALVTSKISAALGECETSATGSTADPFPLVRMFETELCMIQDRYAGEWAPADEVSFLDARLSSYSYVLGQKRTEPLESLHPGNEYITQSSITARQLSIVVTTFPNISSTGTFNVFRAASYAVFFLLRISGTAPTEVVDEAGIRNIIRQTFTLMKDISQIGDDRRSQCVRVCRIIEHMIDYEDWDKDTPFTGKAKSFMANNFVADVAARGMIKARQAERDFREALTAGVQAGVESDLDLDFSTWDPMEWNVNWQESDNLPFLSEDIGGLL